MVMNVLGEHFESVYMGHQMMEAVDPGQIVCVDHLRSTVTENTTISNLNIIHFYALCHFNGKNVSTHIRQYIILFYFTPWSKQKCVAGNTYNEKQ
jgi:hypothetical protein